MKEDTKELLVVGCAILAFSALGFMAGLIMGSRPKKRMAVTRDGELITEEISEQEND